MQPIYKVPGNSEVNNPSEINNPYGELAKKANTGGMPHRANFAALSKSEQFGASALVDGGLSAVSRSTAQRLDAYIS